MKLGAFSVSLNVADIQASNPFYRDLQRQLKTSSIEFQTEADEATSGLASFIIIDPDGNPILVDQHV